MSKQNSFVDWGEDVLQRQWHLFLDRLLPLALGRHTNHNKVLANHCLARSQTFIGSPFPTSVIATHSFLCQIIRSDFVTGTWIKMFVLFVWKKREHTNRGIDNIACYLPVNPPHSFSVTQICQLSIVLLRVTPNTMIMDASAGPVGITKYITFMAEGADVWAGLA